MSILFILLIDFRFVLLVSTFNIHIYLFLLYPALFYYKSSYFLIFLCLLVTLNLVTIRVQPNHPFYSFSLYSTRVRKTKSAHVI